MIRVAIVGAGPAGIAAAGLLVERRLQVTVIDEARDAGGQVFRKPAPGLSLDMKRVLGGELEGYRRFHAEFAALRPRIDWRPDTLVWNIHGRTLQLVSQGVQSELEFDALILATGATDRVAPLEGWTLPGVYTLGASQVLLKEQGCLVGQEVVFCGSSPLLYLVALQYLRLGAKVSVLDTTPFAAKFAAIPRLAAVPTTLMKGLGYLAGLKRAGALIRHGVRLLRFEGTDGVAAVHYRDAGGAEHRLPCDAVAYGFGLRPEAQLAELAGVKLHFDPMHRQWFPFADDSGRCGNCIYVAGDGAAIGGSDGAIVSGRLAALALLDDRVMSLDPGDLPARLLRLRRFQRGVAQAFAWPHQAVAELGDAVPVCRCENVTAGEVRAALRQPLGGTEANRMKAVTRCGMGRCQGRYCDLAAAELTAATLGRQDQPLDHLRAQPPVKPLPIATAVLDEDWP